MADGDGLNAFNESLRTIAVHRSDQTQLLEKYNNFHVDLTGIPNFDGTGESAWHFIQALTILSQSRGWPTGQKGTGRFINAANVYTEAKQMQQEMHTIHFQETLMQQLQPNKKRIKDWL